MPPRVLWRGRDGAEEGKHKLPVKGSTSSPAACSPPPICRNIANTPIHTHMHTHVCTYTHARPQSLSLSLSLQCVHVRALSCSRTHAHADTQARERIHAETSAEGLRSEKLTVSGIKLRFAWITSGTALQAYLGSKV